MTSSAIERTFPAREAAREGFRLQALDRFILLGAVGDPGAAEALDRLIDEDVDWTDLLATAQYNRVLVPLEAPLLRSPRVPGPVKAAVALQVENIRSDTRRTLDGFEHLLPVVLRYHRVVLLRGIANAYTIHAAEPKRPLGSDADLLIDRPRIPSLSGRLLDHHPVPAEVEALGPPRIECHYNLNVKSSWCVRLAAIDTSELWGRQVPIRIAGNDVGVLAPEDRLVYEMLHNVLKGLVRLYRFVDLIDLIRAEPIDWDVVVERSRRYRVSRSAWINLRLIERLCPGLVPESAVLALAPGPRMRGMIERLLRIETVLHDPRPLPEEWCGYRAADGSATVSQSAAGGSRLLRSIRQGMLQRLLLVQPGNIHKIALGPVNRILFAAYSEAHNAPLLGYWMGRARARVQGR